MKKHYILPSTEVIATQSEDLMKITGPGSVPSMGPGQSGGVSAAKRLEALGNTTVRSSLGSLGSTGSIRSIGTLK